MKTPNQLLAEELVKEVTNSNMTIEKKLRILRLLDEAFREHLGIIFLSNAELSENDILFRSM